VHTTNRTALPSHFLGPRQLGFGPKKSIFLVHAVDTLTRPPLRSLRPPQLSPLAPFNHSPAVRRGTNVINTRAGSLEKQQRCVQARVHLLPRLRPKDDHLTARWLNQDASEFTA
jgi:hypothetical protein